MSSTDTYTVTRYSLDKKIIGSGKLTVTEKGQETILTYKDAEVEATASAFHHPIVALENLRKELETTYQSLLGVNGCRIDTALRASGSFGSYLIEEGKKATESVHMFEATTEIEKLCTVAQHEVAYDRWLESVMPKL